MCLSFLPLNELISKIENKKKKLEVFLTRALFVLLCVVNLVPSACFCYKRKVKRRPWNTSNT